MSPPPPLPPFPHLLPPSSDKAQGYQWTHLLPPSGEGYRWTHLLLSPPPPSLTSSLPQVRNIDGPTSSSRLLPLPSPLPFLPHLTRVRDTNGSGEKQSSREKHEYPLEAVHHGQGFISSERYHGTIALHKHTHKNTNGKREK